MTGESYSSFEKYQYGALASQLFGNKETKKYGKSSLEVLAGKKGLNLGEEALGFIRGTQASEEGMQTAIEIYSGKFQEERAKYSPKKLVGWYNSLFEGLEKSEKDKITDVLNEFDEDLGKIGKKFQKASYITEGENVEDLFTKEQIKEAKKTVEKYGKVLGLMQLLDSYKFEGLRPEAVNEARKQELKGLASRL